MKEKKIKDGITYVILGIVGGGKDGWVQCIPDLERCYGAFG